MIWDDTCPYDKNATPRRMPLKKLTAPYGGASGEISGFLDYCIPPVLKEVESRFMGFRLVLDNTLHVDTRPGNNLHEYLDSYLDAVRLPFVKGDVLVNGVSYTPDATGRIVFYDRKGAASPSQTYVPPAGNPAMSGTLDFSYEIDWDRIACETEDLGVAEFDVTNFSRTEDGRNLGAAGAFAYTFVYFKAATLCDILKSVLISAGYITNDGTIRMDLLNGRGIAYDSTNSGMGPSSPGYGWSLPNHYRRVEILAKGHLVFKDGATPLLRWKKEGDSYLPVDPKNLVKAGLLEDGRIVLTMPEGSRLYFDTQANRGRILAEEDRNGNTVTYQYEEQDSSPDGFLANVQDGRGRTLFFVHGSDGQPLALRDVRGTKSREQRFEYYEDGPHKGKLRAQIEPMGDRVELSYDDVTGLLRQVVQVYPDKDPAVEPRRVIEVEFGYFTEGLNAGKVRTETFLIDPETRKAQRRNTYNYSARAEGGREVTVVLEDLADPSNPPRRTKHVYDSQDRLVEVVDPLENKTTYAYGDDRHPGQPTTITDPNLVSTHFGYNEQGNLVYVRDAEGRETRHKYAEDLYGDARPNHRNLLYEIHRPPILDPVTLLPRTAPTTFGYDERGNLETVTDALGRSTTFTRRGDGLVTEVKDRRGKITRFGYNEHGNLETITTPGTEGESPALTTRLEYDPEQFDRVLKLTDPSGAAWSYEYDDLDRLVKTTDPRGHSVSFEYVQGRLESVVAPANHGSGGRERRTGYRYDLADRLESILAEVTPGGAKQMRVRYEYDGLDQLRSLVRLMNQAEKKTSYEYDVLGRHTATTDPLLRTSSTKYAAFCKERTHVSAEGRRNTLAMDQLCRLRELENGDGRTSFQYDPWSRLIRVEQPGGKAARYGTGVRGSTRYGDESAVVEAKEFRYDDLDRLVEVTFPDRKSIQYEHDEEGNVTAVTDVTGLRTEYTYLDDNRLRTVSQGGQTFRYEYGADGWLQRLNYPSSTGIVAHFSWDVAGNLEGIHYRRGGVSLHKMAYLYDPSGNRSHFIDTPMDLSQARTWEYRYDGLNRLKTVHQDGALVSFYDFDESDNRLRMDKLLDGVLHRYDYSYDAADQISGIRRDDVALFEFRHDRDGNMTAKTDLVNARSDAYTWNDSGRLVSISVTEAGQPEKTSRHEYDAGNIRKRRIGSDGSRTDYYYSGLPALTEIKRTVSGNEPTSFLLGHQVLGYTRNGQCYWFISDALGSVRAVVDSAGDIVAAYKYDEYGSATGIHSSDDQGLYIRAHGVERAEQVLNYMRHRWYDCSAGRFLSQDPIGTAGGLNLYAYVGNSPINYADPEGLQGPMDYEEYNPNAYHTDWRHQYRPKAVPLPEEEAGLEPNIEIAFDRLGIKGDVTRKQVAGVLFAFAAMCGARRGNAKVAPALQRAENAAARHGGKRIGPDSWQYPNKRAAVQAASEITGNLGPAPVTIRKKDYRGADFPASRSNKVIGKQTQDKSHGWRIDYGGHQFGATVVGPHVNAWVNGKEFNFHLHY